MSTNPRSEREAQREVLRDALLSLNSGSKQTDHAVDDVLRAIDVYIDRNARESPPVREAPVADFDRKEQAEVRWALWVVIGGAVVATIAVAFLVSGGGWPTGLAVLAVWIAALFALTQT